MALAAVAAVGLGLSVYGQIKQGQAQADAANRDAANKSAMAQETLNRAALNKASFTRQMNEQVGNQSSQYAAGNVAVGSGSPLATMENTLAVGRQKIFMAQEQADWEAQQDLIGAGNERDLAQQYQQAGLISGFGSLITGAAGIGNKNVGLTTSPGSGGGGGSTLLTGSGYSGSAGGSYYNGGAVA